MNRRQKIIISVTGIFLVLLILVGLTYAYFLTQIQGNENDKSISVTTANLILEYGDGNGILETDKLEPSNDFISFKDSEGNSVPSKIFTVTNKGNATVEGYKVYLENVQNQLERKDDLVYTLSCKSYINYGETNQAESGTCTGVSTETTFPSVMTSIVSNDINVGITHVYELNAKYKEMNVDQSIDMNKNIIAKINIYDGTTKFLAGEILKYAKSGDSGRTTYVEPSMLGVTENTSIPAQSASLENEKVLSYAFDDYGTSYYYRGNVEDNYVNFNNMCWRVVRVEGDGSVKLILDDNFAECNDTETNDKNSDGQVYTGYWDIAYEQWYDPYYGYKSYNDSIIADLLNGEQSMVNGIREWVNDSGIDISKLKEDNWLLDNQTDAYDSSGNLLTNETTTVYDLMDAGKGFYYESYKRIYGLGGTTSATLKHYNSYKAYASTLTADEIVFAGGTIGNSSDSKYYLNQNNNGEYRLLSIFAFNGEGFGKNDLCFSVLSGNLSSYTLFDDPFSPRVSVTLKTSTPILYGNGTQEEPYVID